MIGILGGIGSGKSSVVRNVDGFRLVIINADRIGHELLFDPSIQVALRAAFGGEIFASDGTVNRSNLANLVFGETDEHRASLAKLNQILHPAIRRQIHQQIDSASNDVDAIILDAALLLEGGWDATCDWLVFIDTPIEIRRQRVMDNRSWSSEELAKREATQVSIDVKKDKADFVVDNSGRLEVAVSQMEQVFRTILNRS